MFVKIYLFLRFKYFTEIVKQMSFHISIVIDGQMHVYTVLNYHPQQ